MRRVLFSALLLFFVSLFTLLFSPRDVCATNNASCGSISYFNPIVAGGVFSATIPLTNTGNEVWTSTGTGANGDYALGSTNPDNNFKWSQSRMHAIPNVGVGATRNFSAAFTAPTTPGTQSFDWRMVKELVEWFGPVCTTNICVVPVAPTGIGVSGGSVVWNSVSGATHYMVRIDDLSNGFNGSCTTPNPGDGCADLLTSLSYPFSFQTNKNYDIWVHAYVSSCGGWSSATHYSYSTVPTATPTPTNTPTPTPTPYPTVVPGGWTYCANEGGTCNWGSWTTKEVLYGNSVSQKYISKIITGNSKSCTNASFGADPAPSQWKKCWYRTPLAGNPTSTPVPTPTNTPTPSPTNTPTPSPTPTNTPTPTPTVVPVGCIDGVIGNAQTGELVCSAGTLRLCQADNTYVDTGNSCSSSLACYADCTTPGSDIFNTCYYNNGWNLFSSCNTPDFSNLPNRSYQTVDGTWNSGTQTLQLTKSWPDNSTNGIGSPNAAVTDNCFSGTYVGEFGKAVPFTGGTYYFHLTANNSASLYFDGELKVADTNATSGETCATVSNVTAGSHIVKVNYTENTGSASVNAIISKTSICSSPNTPTPIYCPSINYWNPNNSCTVLSTGPVLPGPTNYCRATNINSGDMQYCSSNGTWQSSGSGCSCSASPPTPTITPTPTNTPVPGCPVQPAGIQVNGNTISWNASSGATSYDLRIDDQSNSWTGNCSSMNPGDVCTNVSGTSYNYSPGFVAGRTYLIWVHSLASGCYSASSSYTHSVGGASNPPTCSISGPPTLNVGQSGTFNSTCSASSGGLTSIEIYSSPTSSESWSFENGCNVSGASGSCSATMSFSSPGTYSVPVNAYRNGASSGSGDTTTRCTGNTFGIASGWSDCGGGDAVLVTVNPPPQVVNILTVSSVDQGIQPISGYYTTISPTDATGTSWLYTTANFNVISGSSYTVNPQNYGNYVFNHWQDNGNTSPFRTISINSDTTLVAVYSYVGGSSSGGDGNTGGANTCIGTQSVDASGVCLTSCNWPPTGSTCVNGICPVCCVETRPDNCPGGYATIQQTIPVLCGGSSCDPTSSYCQNGVCMLLEDYGDPFNAP